MTSGISVSLQFLDRLDRRSSATREAYESGLLNFAKCFNVDSPDLVVGKIKTGELDLYGTLDKFLEFMIADGFAPKTTCCYLSSVKSYLRYEGLVVDNYQLRIRSSVPSNVESSLDRIPTRDEMRVLLMDSNPRSRALVALLVTSGLRIGEAAALRVGHVNLLENKVTVAAARSKSRKTRITFITDETAKLLRDYLKGRENEKEAWLFPRLRDPTRPAGKQTLYMLIYRTLTKAGLGKKLDPESWMYELHPHAFRKYFFTKLIGAGVDRGVAEYLMGHKFGLDNAYLRMDEDRLRKEYMKAADDFVFLTDKKLDKEGKERIDYLQDQIKLKDAELTSILARLDKLEATRTERLTLK
jgi:integrase